MLEKTCKSLQRLAQESHKASRSKIAESLLLDGCIKTIQQKNVSTGKEWHAAMNYLNRYLLKCLEKNSTGAKGQMFEVCSHAYAAEQRGTPWAVADVRCRAAGRTDMILPCKNGKRLYIEIKEGEGCLTVGETAEEALNTLLTFGESKRWIAWLFDPRNFALSPNCDYKRIFVEQPVIFLPVGELLDLLEEVHPKGLATWLRCVTNEERGGSANFQRAISSNKKMDILYSLYDEYSYDYQKFIATGELVRLRDE